MFVQKIRHLIRNVYDGYECDEQIGNVDLSVVPSVLVDPPLHSVRRQISLPGRVEQFCGVPNDRDGEVSIFVVDQIRIENVCDFRCVHGVVVVLVVVVTLSRASRARKSIVPPCDQDFGVDVNVVRVDVLSRVDREYCVSGQPREL